MSETASASQETQAGTKRHPAAWATAFLAWALMLSPLLVYLGHADEFSRLPQNDYYGVMETLTGGRDHLPTSPLRWLTVKSNEHRVTFPALVYAANATFNRGHNLGLSLFTLGLMAISFCLLYGFLPEDLRRSRWRRVPWGLALAAFAATPVAAHCVFLGFSGTMWFFSNVFALAAIACWVRGSREESASWFWAAAGFGLLGAFTYSTHLSLWPALLVGLLLLGGSRWRFAAFGLGATLVFGLYTLSYKTPAHHPDPNTSDVGSLWEFLATFLGGLFSRDVASARIAGIIGLALAGVFAVLLALSPRERRRRLTPWAMIAVYALGNALGTSVGRSGLGLDLALSSRYASIHSLFWIGVVAGSALWLREALRPGRARRLGLGAVALAILGLALLMYQSGAVEVERQLRIARHQPFGELAMFWRIGDPETLRWISPAPDQVFWAKEYFVKSGHVPYDRERLPYPYTRDVDPARLAEPRAELRGAFDDLELLGGEEVRVLRVSGWAYEPGREIAEVWVVGNGATIHGETVSGLPRPDVARALELDDDRVGWGGYLLFPCEARELTIYVRLDGETLFHPLHTLEDVRRAYGGFFAEACGSSGDDTASPAVS